MRGTKLFVSQHKLERIVFRHLLLLLDCFFTILVLLESPFSPLSNESKIVKNDSLYLET